MSSWFNLYLDTTPPMVDIQLLNYTSRDIVTYIKVQTNEELADEHEVYIIDSLGQRFDYVFKVENNDLYGQIMLDKCALGVATIYVRVKDVVGNVSDLISKSFNIVKSSKQMIVYVKDMSSCIVINELDKSKIYTKDKTSSTYMEDKILSIHTNVKNRRIVK